MLKAVITTILLLALRVWGAAIIIEDFSLTAPYGELIIDTIGILLSIATAYLIDRLVRIFYWDFYHQRRRKRQIPALIQDIFTGALLTLGACFGLYVEVGLSATGLFTASGATAIVLGIALQAVIQDLFSGLSVNFDKSYTIGDRVTVYMAEMPETFYGTVTGIGWRSTYLRLSDHSLLIVPNRILTSNWMVNHSQPKGPKRYFVEVSVSTSVPYDRCVRKLMTAAYRAAAAPDIASWPEPHVLAKHISNGSTTFDILFYADPSIIEPEKAKAIVLQQVLDSKIFVPRTAAEFSLPSDCGRFVAGEMCTDDIRDVLTNVPLFANTLDRSQIETLGKDINTRELDANFTFIQQGDEASSMFIILEGVARVSVEQPSGASKQVAILTDGDIVGEMSLMTGAPRSATVTTISQVKLAEITKDSISALLNDSPQLLEHFSIILAHRQQELGNVINEPTRADANRHALFKKIAAYFSTKANN